MDHLKIHVIVQSQYQVFDRSGRLPFSIVFGLVRRSAEDTDPRPVIVNTANSILDVPYALSNNLLQLRVHNAKWNTDVAVDVGKLSQTDSKSEPYVALPSPVGREGNWRKAMLTYHCHIDPGSELASILEPGEKYAIRNYEGNEFGGEYAYGDLEPSSGQSGKPPATDQNPKMFSVKANGRATFTTVPSLSWPPKIQTRMQRYQGKADISSDDEKSVAAILEIAALNIGNEAITVQTRGRQRFLVPSGPMQEEEGHYALDPRYRIIDPEAPTPATTIQVLDAATGAIVREARKPSGYVQYAPHDPRPKLEALVTLKPGEPLIRHVDISDFLSKLPDGKFGLRMEARGMWWCVGSCEDFKEEGEDRVPQRLFETKVPPLMLECEDVVEVQVENGAAI